MKKTSLLGQNIFKKTRELETKITSFLLNIIQAGLFYQQALENYLSNSAGDVFLSLQSKVSHLEKENDAFRREIEKNLYAYMILPDMRSDVLKLLESCDKVINKYESNLLVMRAERPNLPDFIKQQIMTLVSYDIECASALVGGVKAFFEAQEVTPFSQYALEWEHKADKLALKLKEEVFNAPLELAHQLQLKEFIYHIEKISDLTEDAVDILNIMAVKHSL